MISLSADLIAAIALAQVSLIVAGLVYIALQEVVQARRRRRRQAVQLHLARYAFDRERAPVPVALRQLRPSVRAQILSDLAGELSGRDLVTLTDLADLSGVTSLSARWSRSRWWRRRLRGGQIHTALVASGPVTYRLLDDPHPMVRAEASRAAARHPSADLCRRLVSMLDDPSTECRIAATEALMRSGADAVTAVVDALARPDAFGPAATMRVEALLEIAAELADPALVTAAIPFTEHVRAPVRAAAIAAVGASRHPGSDRYAADMLADSDPHVRMRAATALGMLAAPLDARLLVPGLSDPVWAVREASALALLGLGAMGRTYLRWVGRGDDAGSDMARRILDLPSRATDLHHSASGAAA